MGNRKNLFKWEGEGGKGKRKGKEFYKEWKEKIQTKLVGRG